MRIHPVITCRVGGSSVSVLAPDPADLQRPADELRQFKSICESNFQKNNRRLKFLSRRSTPLLSVAAFASIFFIIGLSLSIYLVANYGISPLSGEVAKVLYIIGFSATSGFIGGYLGYLILRPLKKRLVWKKRRLAQDLRYAERLLECRPDSGAC